MNYFSKGSTHQTTSFSLHGRNESKHMHKDFSRKCGKREFLHLRNNSVNALCARLESSSKVQQHVRFIDAFTSPTPWTSCWCWRFRGGSSGNFTRMPHWVGQTLNLEKQEQVLDVIAQFPESFPLFAKESCTELI